MNDKQRFIMQIAFAVVAMALMFADASAGGWRGALGGAGAGLEEVGRMTLDSALQEERERRLMQQRFEQERALMERQIQVQQAAIQQQQVRQLLSEQQRMIEEREKIIAALEAENAKLRPYVQEWVVYRKYPTWVQTVNTPAFSAWLTRQTPGVQALADSNRAHDAIRLLDLYYAETDMKRKK